MVTDKEMNRRIAEGQALYEQAVKLLAQSLKGAYELERDMKVSYHRPITDELGYLQFVQNGMNMRNLQMDIAQEMEKQMKP